MKQLFYEVQHFCPNFHEFTGSKTIFENNLSGPTTKKNTFFMCVFPNWQNIVDIREGVIKKKITICGHVSKVLNPTRHRKPSLRGPPFFYFL